MKNYSIQLHEKSLKITLIHFSYIFISQYYTKTKKQVKIINDNWEQVQVRGAYSRSDAQERNWTHKKHLKFNVIGINMENTCKT